MPISLAAATNFRSRAPEEGDQMRFRAGFCCLRVGRVGWNEWRRGEIELRGVSFPCGRCSLVSYPDMAGSGRKVHGLDARLGAGESAGCSQ